MGFYKRNENNFRQDLQIIFYIKSFSLEIFEIDILKFLHKFFYSYD